MHFSLPRLLTITFQFHKGSIQTAIFPRAMLGYIDFNSIKVQFKRRMWESHAAHQWFQFHKGSIQTILPLVTLHLWMDFNSIKVQFKLHRSHIFITLCPDFNSIKVQFKPPIAALPSWPRTDFNSIKVQFKRQQVSNSENCAIISIP